VKLVVYGKNVIALFQEEKIKIMRVREEDANFEKKEFTATNRERSATNG